jgi:peptide deformylase
MSILRVARLGHPALRQKAADVDPADIRRGKFRRLIDDMFETMVEYQGVGLAGPQVHESLRIFVYAVEEEVARRRKVDTVDAGVYFNASLEFIGEPDVVDWEGCLSVPLLAGKVPRYSELILRGLDTKGEPVEQRITGYTARIFQHEVDHTLGHVYLDRMPDLRSLQYTVTL